MPKMKFSFLVDQSTSVNLVYNGCCNIMFLFTLTPQIDAEVSYKFSPINAHPELKP